MSDEEHAVRADMPPENNDIQEARLRRQRKEKISASDDSFFFSPDVGKLVSRGDFLYTEYGHVVRRSDGAIRMMPIDSVNENYADWTEERRCAVRAAIERQCELEKTEETVHRAHRDSLVSQARTKLTEEEFEACYDSGFEDGRGY
jgi:hypothetical protein